MMEEVNEVRFCTRQVYKTIKVEYTMPRIASVGRRRMRNVDPYDLYCRKRMFDNPEPEGIHPLHKANNFGR